MLDEEKLIDAVFTECVRLGSFQAKDLFDKFVESGLSGEDTYYVKKNVTSAMDFLDSKKLLVGETRPEFTQGLRALKEVKYSTLTTFGRVVTRAPRALRLGLFFVLLQWKRAAAILGALASVKLLHNAYHGITLLMGWIEYVSFLVLVWIVYLLIRRALG